MPNLRLTPGSMGVVGHAVDLFGIGKVNPGDWTTPVYLINLTDEEARFAKEFFAEYGVSAEEVPAHEVPR